ANITAKTLTVTGLTANNKTYAATTTGAFSGTPSLQTADAPGAGSTGDGKPYTGDAVNVGGTATGTFANKDAANGIAVSVSGNTLSGAQAGDYVLAANEQSGLTANINPKTLMVTGLSVSGTNDDDSTAAMLCGTASASPVSAPRATTRAS